MDGSRYGLKTLLADFPASVVVFLVALPLCLGIALASNAPLFSGVIAGIVGGVVVAWVSGSHLSVSGPAAGLTVIVANGIEQSGGFAIFSLAVMLAGVIQLIFGYMKAGLIAAFFPSSVIKGMLAAIGIILIIKQLPHATGFDMSFDGDESYMQETASSSLTEIFEALGGISPGATIVSIGALLIMLLWDSSLIKQYKWSRLVPAPLLAVIWGVSYKLLTAQYFPAWQIADQHLVSLPVLGSPQAFFQQLSLPDFSQLTNPVVFKIAITLALVASLETLLSVEAVDKLDPLKRITPTNRELKAQGIGNLINGLIGGLPMTAVIVRSSANINAGGQTRISSFLHGIMLLVSVLFFAPLLNQVPLACLASILLLTGYKLAKPDLFSSLYKQGWGQFAPFVITVVAILVTDLLQGIVIGILTGLFFVLKGNYQASITLTDHEGTYLLRLHKDVSFLNKALLRRYLMEIPDNCELIIDGQRAHFIDHDILETIADFNQSAKDRNISLEFKGILLVKD